MEIFTSTALNLRIINNCSDFNQKYLTIAKPESDEFDRSSSYRNMQNMEQANRCGICAANILDDGEYGDHDTIVDSRTGDKICQLCGEVIEDHCIDQGRDYRAFTAEEQNSRDHYGKPYDHKSYDAVQSTVIGDTNKDCNGSIFAPNRAALWKRLNKWDLRHKNGSREQSNYKEAKMYVQNIASPIFLNLPDFVIKDVLYLYKNKILTNKDMKGRNIKANVLTLVFITCNNHKIPKSVEEICKKCDISKKEFNKARHKIMKILNLKCAPSSAKDYIHQIITDLNIDDPTVESAAYGTLKWVNYYSKMKNKKFNIGKDPAGIAAGAVYLACCLTSDKDNARNKRTQQQISKVTKVTEVTLRDRYKEICDILQIDPSEIRT